jgi:hypothetical protein
MVRRAVESEWKTGYALSLDAARPHSDSWVVPGVLSKTSLTAPIPRAVVHCEFLVRGGTRILFRAEQGQAWRPLASVREAVLDRVVRDKLRVGEQHADIARDAFGASRAQLAFARGAEEERKLAEAKEEAVYSEESEDESFADARVFGSKGVPQYVADESERVISKNIEVVEAVEAAFVPGAALDYRETLAALDAVRAALGLLEDDVIVLHSLVRLRGADGDVSRLVQAVVATLQRRLTHPKYPAAEWGAELLAVHSFGLPRTVERVLLRLQEHRGYGAGGEPVARAVLREALLDAGDGLLAAEVEAVLAAQGHAQPGDVDEQKSSGGDFHAKYCVPEPPALLAGRVRRVRLAFCRDAYLRCSSLKDLRDHMLELVGAREEAAAAAVAAAPPHSPGAAEAGAAQEGQEGEQLVPRAQLFSKLVADPSGVVVSKQMAMRLLATLPSSSDSILDSSAADMLSPSKLASATADALAEVLWPERAARNARLAARASCAQLTQALTGTQPEAFNAALWAALEPHVIERGGVALVPTGAFLDALSTLLGEELAPVLAQSIAAANAEPGSAGQDVLCAPLQRLAFDYVQQLCHALAVDEERLKERALDDKLADFLDQLGELQILAIKPEPKTGDVRVTVLCEQRNLTAEALFKLDALAQTLGLDDAGVLLATEESSTAPLPHVQRILGRSLFLDDKQLILHVPL